MTMKVQFPDVNCGEMLTRWDMIQAPPDILITNINVKHHVLLRMKPIIDQTKECLGKQRK